MKVDPYLIPYTEVNSKWSKCSDINHQIVKPLGKNTGRLLHNTGLGKDFLDITLKAQSTKAKINKYGNASN